MSGWISYDAAGNRQEWGAPSEDGVALKLAEAQAGKLRYCHDARAWFVYDGAVWRRDRLGVPTRLVREIARGLARDPGGKVVVAPGKPAFAAGVLRFARDDPALAVTAQAWDKDPYLLGTPVGPIDLTTGAPVPADPADGISRASAFAPAPPGTEAPRWRLFLEETFAGDAALIGFVQRALGYLLTGSTAERCVILGCGPSGTGKTTLLSTVLHVFGGYGAMVDVGGLSRHDGGAVLAGLRLAALGDVEVGLGGRGLARLVGGDPLGDGRVPTAKLLAMARHPPRLARAEDGLRERLLVVPFSHRPTRPDRRLDDALTAEAPAILRWMIEGCLAWQAQGLDPPPAVVAATAEHLDRREAIDDFLAARSMRGREATAGAGDLWRAWCAFAEAQGETAGSQRLFAEALAARGFTRDRTDTARFYRGLALRPEQTA